MLHASGTMRRGLAMRTSAASEPRERSGARGAPASERVGEFEGRSPSINEESDLFMAELLGETEAVSEHYGDLVEVPGFFGPNDVRRTEQQIRDAVVQRATA